MARSRTHPTTTIRLKARPERTNSGRYPCDMRNPATAGDKEEKSRPLIDHVGTQVRLLFAA